MLLRGIDFGCPLGSVPPGRGRGGGGPLRLRGCAFALVGAAVLLGRATPSIRRSPAVGRVGLGVHSVPGGALPVGRASFGSPPRPSRTGEREGGRGTRRLGRGHVFARVLGHGKHPGTEGSRPVAPRCSALSSTRAPRPGGGRMTPASRIGLIIGIVVAVAVVAAVAWLALA